MRSRAVVLILLLGLATLPASRGGLLQLERLKRPAAPFTLKLDLFHGPGAALDRGGATPVAAAQAESLQKSIAEEIAQSISCEGFIMKGTTRSALLNVSGESFLVSEGDSLLDKIKILKIGKDTVTIEYDNQPYEIRIKGE